FIESRMLPLHYLQIYHSILLARRLVKLDHERDPNAGIARHRDFFLPDSLLLRSTISDPMRYIASRCQAILHRLTSTCQLLLNATSKQIWDVVFQHFYRTWHYAQHPCNPSCEPHSLFPCYMSVSNCVDTRLPLYLSILNPTLSSIIS